MSASCDGRGGSLGRFWQASSPHCWWEGPVKREGTTLTAGTWWPTPRPWSPRSPGITVPASPGVAPPGRYLLFALDAQGVPSTGKEITIGW